MEVQQIIDASDLVKGTIFHLNVLHIYYVVLFSVTSHLFLVFIHRCARALHFYGK